MSAMNGHCGMAEGSDGTGTAAKARLRRLLLRVGCSLALAAGAGALFAIYVELSAPVCVLRKVDVARHRLAELRDALERYAAARGGSAAPTLEALLAKDERGGPYLRGRTAVPLDPWKRAYVYVPPSGAGPYRLVCLGRDGRPGGEGDDADIEAADLDSCER